MRFVESGLEIERGLVYTRDMLAAVRRALPRARSRVHHGLGLAAAVRHVARPRGHPRAAAPSRWRRGPATTARSSPPPRRAGAPSGSPSSRRRRSACRRARSGRACARACPSATSCRTRVEELIVERRPVPRRRDRPRARRSGSSRRASREKRPRALAPRRGRGRRAGAALRRRRRERPSSPACCTTTAASSATRRCWPPRRRYGLAGRARSRRGAPGRSCTARWPPPSWLRPASTPTSPQAIARHTIGGAGMTVLEKCLYLADFCEPGRDFPGVDEVRALARDFARRGGGGRGPHQPARPHRPGRGVVPEALALYNETHAGTRGLQGRSSAPSPPRPGGALADLGAVRSRRRSWPSPPCSAPGTWRRAGCRSREARRSSGYLALLTLTAPGTGKPVAAALVVRDAATTAPPCT